MNDRMYELINQCFIGTTDGRLSELNTISNVERFAELIVGECLDIVANADMTELEGPDLEDVLYVACKQIREHFGVEE